MRWVPSIVFLAGGLLLLGSDCNQELFVPIICAADVDCEAPCEEFCSAMGDEVESAACDANDFCECICGGLGSGGTAGTGGTGGMGTGGSGGSTGECLPTMQCEVGVFGDMDCFELCEGSSGCTIDFCGMSPTPACVDGYCVYQCTDGRRSCDP